MWCVNYENGVIKTNDIQYSPTFYGFLWLYGQMDNKNP